MNIRVAFISKQLSRNPMDGVAVYNAKVITELKKLGVIVYEVWPGRIFTGRWPFYNLYALKYVANLVRERRINIVHSSAADGFLLPYLEDIPYILTIHAVLADEILTTGEFMDSAKRFRLDRLLILKVLVEAERFSANRADIIVVPSAYAKQRVIKHYGVSSNKIEVIPHGVNIEEYKRDTKYYARRDYRNDIKICFVGKIVKRKGLMYLIRAIEILNEKNHKIRVNIIGDGPQRETLERYVKKKSLSYVHFLGGLPRRKVLEELLTCDIFCMPSLHETFGIAILEAMAAGKPVVTSNVGGIPEIVVHGETGFLVPPRDATALAEAIEKLIVDEELRYKMGINAFKRASMFSWKKAAEKLVHLYNKLIRP